MNKRILLGAGVLVGILLVVGVFWLTEKEGDASKPKDSQCPGKNCTKVQVTCCPCNMGGEEKCVNSSEAERYREKLKNCPKNLICAAIYNCNVDLLCNNSRG